MDEFLKACGASGPLDLRIETQGETVPWSAPQPFALIGSDPSADLFLDDPRVDRLHAYLQVVEGEVFWVDLGSEAGTRWENSTSAARSGWLTRQHGIDIGPFLVQLASEGRPTMDGAPPQVVRPDPFASRPQDSDSLPRIVLEFRRDQARPIRWRMRHILTLVGSSPYCKVRLAAPGVAPFHCSLLRTAAGVWVVNLGAGDVTHNGSSIRAARLEDRDELQIGGVTICVFFKTSQSVNGKSGSSAVSTISPVSLVTYPSSRSGELAASRPETIWGVTGRARRGLLTDRILPPGELPESLLNLVFDQFEQMQQQFLDQFQQTALMMFRALGSMHRDQMEELREKLDSLERLGEDFKALQAQVASSLPSDSHPAHSVSEESTLSGSQLAPSSTPAPETIGSDGARSSTENGMEPRRERQRSPVDEPNNPSLNVHEWMIGRLAAIEAEQRTRWQKILDLVRGR
jgi:pSer/pThr/pTyr-binding forkhead associated (FHA) protein